MTYFGKIPRYRSWGEREVEVRDKLRWEICGVRKTNWVKREVESARPNQSCMFSYRWVDFRISFYWSFSTIFKILFRRFYSPESDPPHKIMRSITQPSCVWDFHLTESVRCKWFVLAVHQFWKGISAGPDLKYFTRFIGAGSEREVRRQVELWDKFTEKLSGETSWGNFLCQNVSVGGLWWVCRPTTWVCDGSVEPRPPADPMPILRSANWPDCRLRCHKFPFGTLFLLIYLCASQPLYRSTFSERYCSTSVMLSPCRTLLWLV